MEKLEQDPAYSVVECVSSLDAASLVRRIGPCLILFHVSKEDDLQRHIMMQNLIRQQINRKQVRLLVTTELRDRALNSFIVAQFGSEVLPEPANEKSLLFKIDRLVKSLPQGKATSRSDESAAETAARERGEPGIEQVPPLELMSDCWSVQTKGIRRIGGRWILKVLGPGPEHGAWSEIEAADGGEGAWCWNPADPEHDPFIQEQGSWVCFGRKPEYQSGGWMMNARTPQLGFYYEGECYGRKLALGENGQLQVAQDSEAARSALQLVQQVAAEKAGATPAKGGAAASRLEPEGVGPGAPEIISGEPLELESDCWLIQNRKPKRVANRWSVTLLGPAPHAGKWVSIENPGEAASEEAFWRWVPHDPENDPFIREEGAWVFRGFQPKFSEVAWVFVGESPELSFYYEGESYGSKLRGDKRGRLTVARDSAAALARLPLMEASLDRVVPSKTAQSSEESGDAAEKSATEGAVREFRFALDRFGKGEGEWESVTFGSQQRRWYVYVAEEVLLEQVPDIRKLGRYWTYFGPSNPIQTDEPPAQWVFRDREPQECASFGDLPRPIQEFLVNYFPGREAEAAQAARAAEHERAKAKVSAQAEAPEFVEIKAERASEEKEVPRFVVPLAEFGAEGGEWESVSVGSQLRRWYCYVPAEVLESETPPEIRALGRYWTYFGSEPPRRIIADIGDAYEFAERKPQACDRFGDLPEAVQQFFLEYFPGGTSAAAKEPVGPAEGEPFVSESGPTEVVIRSEAEREASLSVRDYKVFSNEETEPLIPKGVLDLSSREADAAETGTPDLWFKDDSVPEPRGPELFVDKKAESALLELELEAPQSRVMELTVSPERAPSLEATLSREAQGPGAVWAAHPPGPSLSPLAITVLMSELIRKQDFDPKKIGDRFCEYLRASMGGLHVELWIRAEEGGWFCGGASSESETGGKLAQIFEAFDKDEASASLRTLPDSSQAFCSPVLLSVQGGTRVAGALAITGDGCEKVSEAYCRSASKAVVGLVKSLKG